MTYRVYVIENPGGKRYIGLTENVVHRVEQHNAGLSKWTAKFRPWKLIWAGEAMSLSEARRLEAKLKRQKGGSGFFVLTGLQREGS